MNLKAMLDLAELPPGEFVMGETPGDKFATATERPAHRVALDYRFALGRSTLTVGEYRAWIEGHAPEDPAGLPVTNVTWEDSRAFCRWLAERTGEPFRLPTEAEWEYACRAGSCTPFSTGATISTEDANFLYDENGERIGFGRRIPSGHYASNAFGLHDLHGNVCEWVEDAWHADYDGAPADGRSWLGDTDLRVIRGGAWDYLPRLLRSAWRDALPKDERRDNLGFRLALTLPS